MEEQDFLSFLKEYEKSICRKKRGFSSWIRKVKSLDDIKKPGFLKVWFALDSYWKDKLKDWVEKVLHGDWKEVKAHVKYLKKQNHCVRVFKEQFDGAFVLAVQKQLSDHTQVVNVISQQMLDHSILYYRKLGLTDREVASLMNLDIDYVNRIATPQAIDSFGGEDIFRTMVAGLVGKGLIFLSKEAMKEDLPVKDRAMITKLAWEILCQLDDREARRIIDGRKVGLEETIIRKRHKMYAKK